MTKKCLSDFSMLDNLKEVINRDCANTLVEVSLDSELVAYDDLSEDDLLGSAKSSFEEELDSQILHNEKLVKSRLDRLKSYDDDIFL